MSTFHKDPKSLGVDNIELDDIFSFCCTQCTRCCRGRSGQLMEARRNIKF